jgi:hypothetical protein
MTAFRNIAPCSLLEADRRFRSMHWHHHQDSLMTVSVRTSETSVYFNVTIWCYIQESCHLLNLRRENLKSHLYGIASWEANNCFLFKKFSAIMETETLSLSHVSGTDPEPFNLIHILMPYLFKVKQSHNIEKYGGKSMYSSYSFLTSALDWSEWS